MSDMNGEEVTLPAEGETARAPEGQPEQTPDNIPGVENGVAENVTGNYVDVNNSLVGTVRVEQDATLSNSMVGVIGSGRDVALDQSVVTVVGAGRDVTLKGGVGLMVSSGGQTEVQDSRVAFVSAPQVRVANATIGVLLTSQADLGENVRVTATAREAAIFGVAFGAAIGLVFAAFMRLARRR
jgi:hypothetical protein